MAERAKYEGLSKDIQTEHALLLWSRLDPRLRGLCLRTLEAFIEANEKTPRDIGEITGND